MHLISRLRNIYETTDTSSVDHILSYYFLHNLVRIEDLSLTDIAKETTVSKSAVSKFINRISYDKGFAEFKSSLSIEKGTLFIDKQALIRDGKMFKEQYSDLFKTFKEDEIEDFVVSLRKANRILFCGEVQKRSYFDHLINILLLQGKNAKFATWCYNGQQTEDLLSLGTDDLLVIVESNLSLEQFNETRLASVEVCDNTSLVAGKVYYVGPPSIPVNYLKMITLNNGWNTFMNDLLLKCLEIELILKLLKEVH